MSVSEQSDVSEIKQIVDALRQPPFSRQGDSLVSFSNKSPGELLQIVNDVFAQLDSRQTKVLRDEPQTHTAARMLDFIVALAYPIPQEYTPETFGVQFMQGVKTVVYPLLLWLLTRLETLKQRAYLARFLKPMSVPEEHFADTLVLNLYQQLAAKQQEFTVQHRSTVESQQRHSKPQALQRECAQLDAEKQQLLSKLQKLRTRVEQDVHAEYGIMSDHNNNNAAGGGGASGKEAAVAQQTVFAEMLQLTHQLRAEQEEESRLAQQMHEQQQKLSASEQQRASLNTKLSEFTSESLADDNDSNAGASVQPQVVQKLRDDIARLRQLSQSKLDAMLQERERQLKALNKVMKSESMSESHVHELAQQVHETQSQVDALLHRRDEMSQQNGDSDGKTAFFRDRLQASDKKLRELTDQATELDKELLELSNDTEELQRQIRIVVGVDQLDSQQDGSGGGSTTSARPQTDAQMKAYMIALQDKTSHYKQLKSALDALAAESETLQRTELLLRQRDTHSAEFNAERERALAVEGFTATAAQLEQASSESASVNAAKGDTLESISATVTEIQAKLAQRKTTLAPAIKELRSLRHEYEQAEAQHAAQLQQYETMRLLHTSDTVKSELDYKTNCRVLMEQESAKHAAEYAMTILAQRLALLQRAADVSSQYTVDKRYPNAVAHAEALLVAAEQTGKQLRQEKKQLGDTHERHVRQRALWNQLQLLMGAKQESRLQQQQQQSQAALAQGAAGDSGSGYGSQDASGQDRMTFD